VHLDQKLPVIASSSALRLLVNADHDACLRMAREPIRGETAEWRLSVLSVHSADKCTARNV